MPEEAILVALEEYGLTRTEAIVYLTLVKKGKSTAYRVSLDARLYKPNTYLAIEGLIRKNLVTKLQENGKQYVSAVEPDELLSLLEKKKEKLQQIIPSIERSFGEEYTDVSVFVGIDAFFSVFYKLLEHKKAIYAYDIPANVPDLVKTHIDVFHRERIKAKVSMYHVYDETAKNRIVQLKKLKYTFAKEGLHKRLSVLTTIVCHNTTLIVNWNDNIRTVRIIDDGMADSARKQFDILWKLS